MTLIYSLLALLGGAFFPVQTALNAQLGRLIGGPLPATIVSFVVGLAGLTLLYTAAARGTFDFGAMRGVPPYLFIGGLMGATFLGLSVFLTPKIGSGTLMCLVVSGQILTSLLIDYFGLFGLPLREISAARAGGAALVAIGAVVFRLF